MTQKKRGGGVDIFLAIVLAAFLIWQKDGLAPILFWAGWVGVLLFLFNANAGRQKKAE